MTKIFEQISKSDLFVTFLSAHSQKSTWVPAEIDFAVKESISHDHLKVIGIVLDDTKIPLLISNRHVIDARTSIDNFEDMISVSVSKNEQSKVMAFLNKCAKISSASILISSRTKLSSSRIKNYSLDILNDSSAELLFEELWMGEEIDTEEISVVTLASKWKPGVTKVYRK